MRRRVAATVATALVLVAAGVFLFSGRTHDATARLSDTETVTLHLRGMAGLHSDWHRWLSVEIPGAGTTRIDLIADTGWWRGSQLYRRPDGALVLDEGQAGCELLPPADGPTGCPRASDWTYLGRFEETGPGHEARVAFAAASETAEIALPPPL